MRRLPLQHGGILLAVRPGNRDQAAMPGDVLGLAPAFDLKQRVRADDVIELGVGPCARQLDERVDGVGRAGASNLHVGVGEVLLAPQCQRRHVVSADAGRQRLRRLVGRLTIRQEEHLVQLQRLRRDASAHEVAVVNGVKRAAHDTQSDHLQPLARLDTLLYTTFPV